MNKGDFAKYLGISFAAASRYENGIMVPSIDIGMQIAEKCNVTLDWLCGCGSDDAPERRNNGLYSISEEE